jgi:hypothetical protein
MIAEYNALNQQCAWVRVCVCACVWSTEHDTAVTVADLSGEQNSWNILIALFLLIVREYNLKQHTYCTS